MYLPYPQASAWAQQLGLKSATEWDEWLELGEGLTSYVPRDPEAHFRERGVWLGWRAFLTGDVAVGGEQ